MRSALIGVVLAAVVAVVAVYLSGIPRDSGSSDLKIETAQAPAPAEPGSETEAINPEDWLSRFAQAVVETPGADEQPHGQSPDAEQRQPRPAKARRGVLTDSQARYVMPGTPGFSTPDPELDRPVNVAGTEPEAEAELPAGWSFFESVPGQYVVGLEDPGGIAFDGARTAYLAAATEQPQGFAVLAQLVDVSAHRNGRLSFTAAMRRHNVERTAEIWFVTRHADGSSSTWQEAQRVGAPLFYPRSADWHGVGLTTSIPPNAVTASVGVYLSGPGVIHVDRTALVVEGTRANLLQNPGFEVLRGD